MPVSVDTATGYLRSAGSVLILVLVFVLIMNGLAVTILQSAQLQLRYSSNLERQLEALQLAESVTTAVRQRGENFPNALLSGESNCAAADDHNRCALNNLTYSMPVPLPDGLSVLARVNRIAPGTREVDTQASGPVLYRLYEIDVEIRYVSGGGLAAHTITGVGLSAENSKTLYWRQPAIDSV